MSTFSGRMAEEWKRRTNLHAEYNQQRRGGKTGVCKYLKGIGLCGLVRVPKVGGR